MLREFHPAECSMPAKSWDSILQINEEQQEV
jgi:hypothetical protein